MPYQAITVDTFPSKKSAIDAFDAVRQGRAQTLSQICALAVRPLSGLPKIIKALGFLSPVMCRNLGTSHEKELIPLHPHPL